MSDEGIDVHYFKQHPERPSGIALIMVGGKERENIIAVAKSANDALSETDIAAAKVLFKRSKVVLAQLEIPLEDVIAAEHSCRQSNELFILFSAPARRLPQSLYSPIDVITHNKNDAFHPTGQTDIQGAAKKLYT